MTVSVHYYSNYTFLQYLSTFPLPTWGRFGVYNYVSRVAIVVNAQSTTSSVQNFPLHVL